MRRRQMISISLCMIVRNEERVLGRCLESVKDFADEIVIVDTGSGDRTAEIAAEFTDRIFHYPWRDDFSAARNFAMDQGQGEYLMWLDADDVIPERSLEKLMELKQAFDRETDVVMLPYVTAFDAQGRPAFSYYRERIVRNSKDFRFTGKVHEVIPPHGKIIYADIPVEHRKTDAGDSDRNLRIYEKMMKDGEEFDARSLYYYGRELLYHGRYREGAHALTEFLERPDGWVENQIDATRQLAYCFYGTGEDSKALQALLYGLSFDVPRGETCCDLGRHFFDRGRYEEAAYWYKQAFTAKRADRSGAFIREECYGFLPAVFLSMIYDRLGQKDMAGMYHDLAYFSG